MVLSRQLDGTGFHRTLLTQVEQVTSQHISDPSVLHVAIVENITCDMYVDIDQVRKKIINFREISKRQRDLNNNIIVHVYTIKEFFNDSLVNY